ncbi:vitellogenin-1-like [Lucilia cuprina]|uniref:vitellogenin-1-like n=1 Tax=Lucilia cuprina TaxID=7375 RepID=UPI001F05239B|nr:vitellogenin-1-like [Lucilia cuprina]
MKLFYTIFLLWSLIESHSVQGRASFGVSNYANSFSTIVKGLGREIPNVIPTPSELFRASKQVLFGLPETAVFRTVNNLCSVYLAADTISPRVTPDMSAMSLRLRTPCEESSYSLTEAENILQNPDFDVSKKLAIFVTGWTASSEDAYVTDMANAFLCRGDYNFLALNSSDSIDTLYTWSAYNTEEVGRQLAEALAKLHEQIPAENIHLIGHSLGAHIVGYAGRYFSEYTGEKIARITGLDPANPCFNEGEDLSGLQRGDAEFIDVIHTNPGVLGKANSVGDVDFYAEGMAPIKPGCVRFGCSHGRAYEYFTESVYPGNEENFLGVRCSSLSKLNNGFCTGEGYPMGFAVPTDLRGNYYLSVNAQQPYGQNNNGRAAVPSECANVCN